ncbi:E3 ubiquitin-protein ligase ZNRF2 [Falco rusticolus]|uniref:E3 ubiquitin-protein ligase ZNRF2 n=1 Tax=Falco rusticolus TaxID=120794 RepID=UPI001886A63B|nr:E3 ubiquitin-protein ligase ZNRF2 [Falco rusticolus]XP_037239705.1 E3 ubiquitin-protein ligase ZNRF2 [Falco rusticolus]XP_055563881.1 E3 ubiquitin-protein ligase ZNRF2 [Falco cherrug]XP_055563882.1 E3 ubiquitin-protein ligase ZNRF2 [Falco cherrug]XP_055659900.1 E3 ubiquitin-protein ligase ZNRF2 [Falco peregrinus]XP_055659901.1 E3 ubiquitin-protein ligase ZNRF2 [Falco peregrinus]
MVAPQTREQRPRRGRQLSRIPAGGSPFSTPTHRATRSPPPALPLPPPQRNPRLRSPPPGPDSRHPRAPGEGGSEGHRPAPGGGGTMGAKQSSPTTANGRTRAYSGGDLPSSSSSSSGGANGTGGRSAGAGGRYAHLAAAPHAAPGGAAATAAGGAAAGGAAGSAPRSRSLGGATAAGARAAQSAFNIPHSSGPYGSQDSVNSTPEEGGRERPAGGGGGTSGGPRLVIGSLPAHLSPHLFGGFKCPVCSKFVSSDEMDLHLVMCLTKPRITYNEDVLSKDAGECAICLEELQQGDTIARLPCLCIYHKGCIDEWFEVNRSCPEHPSD